MKWKFSLSSSASLESWSVNNISNHCRWIGIRCNAEGSVCGISLPSAGLAGTLDLFHFTALLNLTTFNLSGNYLDGSVPAALGNLTSLNLLDLSDNLFSDAIPPEIGRLTELRYLSFSNNYMVGEIPYQIGNLRKVRFLHLGSNYFKSPDWSRFPNFPFLIHLNLRVNELNLEFPHFITTCLNLTFLDLSQNNFTCQIPETLFSNLVKLEYLNLTSNSFQGPLSPNITNLSKLKDLRLTENLFSGKILDSVSLIPSLQNLELYNNSFIGEIPPSIGLLTNLQSLDLRMNRFNSSIPRELGLCNKLTYIDLSQNSLSGPLPPSLSNLGNLSELYLSHNSLIGEILTSFITSWRKLISLLIEDNEFSGELPSEIGLLTNLEYL
ncbi:leucine-rich repeat receptor-like serine/threonine-protein kinase RGI4 isoform X1 [Salvia splendens]|uniref:leucine-rich repeat receptor-like serine/threonine-protein kinase RGI4 isoform X1 n=1 Tax=Salvia splendens TaxID=180675 RepID=UPI001C262F9C|nr:leucine-rich repeat receptor-like serine/threonine-protein kinase RGI4 isoform X1 [Salvia splendens]XP_042013920.1 leucine-rich repeat receptor-like serine/threonine-protein kinase RGI4 isoform X1 [Salvia splendens]XP_042013922.1 leucine-rich repeat receptor-like serine/threonine-protein kinase RGI4 isoform X1 [Salvia splendens]